MNIIKFLVLAIGLIFVSGLKAACRGDDPVREKARYYFTQGSVEASDKNMVSAYEYFKKAYETDPSFSDAAFTYGGQRLFVQTDTLQTDTELKKSLGMLRQYVDEYPNDLYAAQMYGFIAARMDTVGEAIRVYERIYGNMPRETMVLLNLAEAYMMAHKPGEAVGAIERYENIEGKSSPTSLKKISYLLAGGDTVGAVKEADLLIESNPRDPYNFLLKGNLYEVIGNTDSVYAAYKEAERLAPENGNVKMSMANLYRAMGDSVKLDATIYEALLSEDFEIEEKVGILGEYLQKLIDEKGEKSRGDYLFKVLMQQYPHEPGLLDMSARYSAAKGDFREAAEEIRYAIDLDATNEKYWLMLMSYLLADSRYEDIVDVYSEIKAHIEPTPAMKNLYSGAASQLENSERGKQILLQLLKEVDPGLEKEDPETVERLRKTLDYDGLTWVSSLYCMIGDLDYKTGNPDEGFRAYETSLRFNPDNALTLNNYAYFLSEENKELEKAKKMSRRSLDLSENNPTYLDTYAWILYKMGEYEEALDYQKLAMDLAKEAGDENEEFKLHLDAIEKALNASQSNP